MVADLYSWVDTPDYSWSDQPYIQWAIAFGYSLNQIWQDALYVYAVTTEGLDVIDLLTTEKVAFIPWETGFTTVWASEDTIYLGTTTGVKYLYKTSILGDAADPINLIAFLNSYTYFAPASIKIKYLHGFENKLSIVTNAGIDLVDNTTGGYKSSNFNTDIGKCFSMSDRSVYYTVNSPTTSGIFKVNTCLVDWVEPAVSYTVGASFLPSGVIVNDIFITENTAISGSHTIFTATSSGVFIFDEDSLIADHYTSELAGTSLNFVGVWADLDASTSNGKVYIISNGEGAAFSIFDLNTKMMWDRYTLTDVGRTSQTLLSEDLTDVTGGF